MSPASRSVSRARDLGDGTVRLGVDDAVEDLRHLGGVLVGGYSAVVERE